MARYARSWWDAIGAGCWPAPFLCLGGCLYSRDVNCLGRSVKRSCHSDPCAGELLGLLLVVQLIDRLAGGVEEDVLGAVLNATIRTILGGHAGMALHHALV